VSRSGSNTTRNYTSATQEQEQEQEALQEAQRSSSSTQQQQRVCCVYKNEGNYQPAGAGASSSAWLVLIPSCQQRGVVALLDFGFWLLVRPREGQDM
jgi:hypothetical protein